MTLALFSFVFFVVLLWLLIDVLVRIADWGED